LFAQKLTVHAIDKHYEMGIISALFRSTAKLPRGPAAVLKSFLEGAAKHWFKHATQDDFRNSFENQSSFCRWSIRLLRGSGLPGKSESRRACSHIDLDRSYLES